MLWGLDARIERETMQPSEYVLPIVGLVDLGLHLGMVLAQAQGPELWQELCHVYKIPSLNLYCYLGSHRR